MDKPAHLTPDQHNLVHEYPNFVEEFNAGISTYSNTPAALRGFEKLNQIWELGYINTDLNSTSYDMALEMLVEGQGVYYPMLSFALAYIEENFGDEINNIGSFGQPGDDPDYHGVTLWLPGAIAIPKTSKNIDAAKLGSNIFSQGSNGAVGAVQQTNGHML